MNGKYQGHFARKFTSLFMIITPNLQGVTISISSISPNFLQSMSQNKLAIKENIKVQTLENPHHLWDSTELFLPQQRLTTPSDI